MNDVFRKISKRISNIAGNAGTFVTALAVILIWGLSGHFFKYSDTWQLIINTSTTIITFLMVFLIQNTQNRDSEAVHLKLDELIRAVKGARNSMVSLEELSDKELDSLSKQFRKIHEQYFNELNKRKKGKGIKSS